MDANHPAAAAFRDAVEALDADGLRRLFAESPQLREVVDAPWFAFDSPALVHVVGRGSREMAAALLDLGAHPDCASSWGAGAYTALHRIVDAPAPVDREFADYLIGRGATVDLHAAAGLGHLERVKELLDAEPSSVSRPGPDGATPLHLAADVTVASLLLDRGAELDKRCVDHRSTPAQWSAQGRLEVMRFLLDRGARADLFMAAVLDDPDLAERILDDEPEAISVRARPGTSVEHLGGGDKYVWALDFADTPLEVARRRGHEAVYAFLLEKSSPATRLIQASRRGDVAALRSLVQASPNLLDGLGEDAVCDALCAPPECIRFLVGAGADPNARDDDNGATPLHHAAWRGQVDRVRELLACGANASIPDRTYDATPLGWAHENGQTHVMDVLREAAPDSADASKEGA